MLKMKYFRSYPYGLQLFMFLMLVFTLASFGAWAVLKFTPYTFDQIAGIDEHSPAALVNVGIIVQGVLSLFMFLIPSLLFAYFSHPKPAAYLGIRTPGKSTQILLVIGIMLGAMPILQMTEGLISHINFSAKIKESQAASDSMMNAYLNMPDLSAFIRVFVIMSIIPAVGEELFFRGIIMRFAKKKSRNMVLPTLFTAALFAYAHSNIYGYLSIFVAGILLAVIYNLTGSILCSIVAHLFFNGLQIVLSYMSNSNSAIKNFMTNNTVPYYLVIGGAVLFSISFYFLLKNKTPLPQNWADDFTPEELAQKAY